MATLCPDWVIASGSNVNTAVDRGWFTSYTPYKTFVVDNLLGSGSPIAVCGIGSVTIEVLKHKTNKGKRSRSSITLDGVLHVPTLLCNIIGGPFLAENLAIMSNENLKRKDGSIIAALRPHQEPSSCPPYLGSLLCLSLYKSPETTFRESRLKHNTAYAIRAIWPHGEEEKWISHCNATKNDASSLPPTQPLASPSSVPPYTAAEKQWLKHRSGHKNEFKFLQAHGLSIYREEGREEGRRMVRRLMAQDMEDEEHDEDADEEEEWDPTGHQLDYAFKRDQLDFIEKHWGTSENFLINHGLKFWQDEDVEERVAIVRALMTDDD